MFLCPLTHFLNGCGFLATFICAVYIIAVITQLLIVIFYIMKGAPDIPSDQAEPVTLCVGSNPTTITWCLAALKQIWLGCHYSAGNSDGPVSVTCLLLLPY